jgi:hypothetical protein
MKLKSLLVLVVAAGIMFWAVGCQNGKCCFMCGGKSCSCQAANTVCPMTGKAVNKDVPCTKYDGKRVGFCCKDCPETWGKLSDADKKAKLAAAMEKGPAVVNAKCPMTGSPVDKSVTTRTFEGKTVGFCCGNCPPAWDKLSDAEKKAKLEAAMK